MFPTCQVWPKQFYIILHHKVVIDQPQISLISYTENSQAKEIEDFYNDFTIENEF